MAVPLRLDDRPGEPRGAQGSPREPRGPGELSRLQGRRPGKPNPPSGARTSTRERVCGLAFPPAGLRGLHAGSRAPAKSNESSAEVVSPLSLRRPLVCRAGNKSMQLMFARRSSLLTQRICAPELLDPLGKVTRKIKRQKYWCLFARMHKLTFGKSWSAGIVVSGLTVFTSC